MATVQTVMGAVEANRLGLTLIHEHFVSYDEAVSVQWPHVRDREREYALAREAADAVRSFGVRTVVEPTAMLLGRNVALLRQLASETGLQIVACTGISPTTTCRRSFSTGASISSPSCSCTTSSTEFKARTSKPHSSSAPPMRRASRGRSKRSTVRRRARA
jgi:predicted metal-dependent phosphotriesterase family hydrolase